MRETGLVRATNDVRKGKFQAHGKGACESTQWRYGVMVVGLFDYGEMSSHDAFPGRDRDTFSTIRFVAKSVLSAPKILRTICL